MRTNFDIYVFITEKEEYVLLIYLVVTSFIRVYVIKHHNLLIQNPLSEIGVSGRLLPFRIYSNKTNRGLLSLEVGYIIAVGFIISQKLNCMDRY